MIRKALRIRVAGTAVPPPLKSFADLAGPQHKVSRKLLDAVQAAGFSEPTPIQRQAIPCLLADR